MSKRRVGIVGFGNLGEFLVRQILEEPEVQAQFELAFIYNRSGDRFDEVSWLPDHILMGSGDLGTFLKKCEAEGISYDLVIEAAHPKLIEQSGEYFLNRSELFITSLTALANSELLQKLLHVSNEHSNAVLIPTGAGWGFDDVLKMADLNLLQTAAITMKFHVDALLLNDPLMTELAQFIDSDSEDDLILYEGPVDSLAQLAPNNVNTMCGLALAAHSLGFDRTLGTLLASKEDHFHTVQIHVTGPEGFEVTTKRINPAKAHAVTGSMTFQSFLGSLMACGYKKGGGLHFI